ncbi:MAG: sycD9 [Chlamydiales bacterium]|jgi:type III secretion system low calcium response chaperone LcrH/SycD|nr:sycD9 [Chlamydiales bacterium]
MDLDQLQKAMSEVNLFAGKKAEGMIKDLLSKAMTNGSSPKAALQISEETMEGIYSQGYNLYNQGRYQDASYVFRLLMMLDYKVAKYTLGLAACLHRLGDFSNAIVIYTLVGVLEPTNPIPYYHAADCFLKLGQTEGAFWALDQTIMLSAENEEHAVLKERAKILKQGVMQEMQQERPKQ